MEIDGTAVVYQPSIGARRVHEPPVVVASDQSLRGYGCLVDEPRSFPVEIVRWPARGWRPVDPHSGDQGGVTEGIFEFSWRDGTLYARNNAVGDSYLFGWTTWPEELLAAPPAARRERILLWGANYHPDGGQLFYPLHGESFFIPLALPGDDLKLEHFVTFWCAGDRGLYIHPDIWHGAVVPVDDEGEFLDRQGRVHARVRADFQEEFGCYLAVPLVPPNA